MFSKTILLLTLSVTLSAFSNANYVPKKGKASLYDGLFRNDDLEIELGEIDDLHYSGASEAEIPEESEAGCKAATQRNTDEYIDKVLDETRPKFPDPAFLPERVGRFRLFNGTLENLASLQRAGPAMFRCTENAFSFLVPISLKNLTGQYFWELDAGMPVFRGDIDMFVGNVEADVLYTRQRKTAGRGYRNLNQKAVIEQFKITKLEGVQIKFDGLGAVSRLASRLASRVANLAARFLNRGVSRALEGPVRNAINKELKNVEKYEKYYF